MAIRESLFQKIFAIAKVSFPLKYMLNISGFELWSIHKLALQRSASIRCYLKKPTNPISTSVKSQDFDLINIS